MTHFMPPDAEVTNLVHHSLLDDGKTLFAEETSDGKKRKHRHFWLLEKQWQLPV